MKFTYIDNTEDWDSNGWQTPPKRTFRLDKVDSDGLQALPTLAHNSNLVPRTVKAFQRKNRNFVGATTFNPAFGPVDANAMATFGGRDVGPTVVGYGIGDYGSSIYESFMMFLDTLRDEHNEKFIQTVIEAFDVFRKSEILQEDIKPTLEIESPNEPDFSFTD